MRLGANEATKEPQIKLFAECCRLQNQTFIVSAAAYITMSNITISKGEAMIRVTLAK